MIRLHPVCGVSKIHDTKGGNNNNNNHTKIALMARSSNDQLGGATERQNIKKILKNAKLLHDGCHGSKYMLCSERKGTASRVCSERNTTCENTIVANFAKSKQIYARKTICGDEFAT